MLISSLCKSSASWILLLSYALLDTHLCTLPVAFSNVSPLKNWSFLWTDHVRLHQKLSPAYQSLISAHSSTLFASSNPSTMCASRFFQKGRKYSAVYRQFTCFGYLYLPTLCLLQYISTLPLFGACCGREMQAYMLLAKKRNTYSCICSQRNVLEWKEYVSTITTW